MASPAKEQNVGNVFDAMKKHQQELAQTAAASAAPPDPDGESSSSAGVDRASSAVAVAEPSPGRPVAVPEPQARAAALSAVISQPMQGYSPLLLTHYDRGGPIAEEYRALRTNLLAQRHDQRFCYAVSSALAGEGKTVTTLNLALVMAERQDYRTVVADFDLRRGRLARLLNVKACPGVAEVLRGSAELEDVVQPTAYPNLFVIAAGQARAGEVGELVIRPDLERMVQSLRQRYDYVLLDTPPMNLVAETGMIGRAAGELLMVVRLHKTPRESVERAIRLLQAANIKIGGLVLTQRRYFSPSYHYKYY